MSRYYFMSLFSAAVLVLSFQNCSSGMNAGGGVSVETGAPKNGGLSPGSGTEEGTLSGSASNTVVEGNGGGYEGKIYVIAGTCGGIPNSVAARLKIANDKSQGHLLRYNCQDYATPVPVTIANVTFNGESSIAYQGETYSIVEEIIKTLVYTFSTAGTFSWTKPGVGTSLEVECWGGGGAGGAGGEIIDSWGSGGGGGGYSKRTIPFASLGSAETVTVGAGGVGVDHPSYAGNPGGTSSFGSHLAATGGQGGIGFCAAGPVGGAGGTGTTANGAAGSGTFGTGGTAGGSGGGAGGGPGVNGASPGGGGGSSQGIPTGSPGCGPTAGPGQNGGTGRCVLRVI